MLFRSLATFNANSTMSDSESKPKGGVPSWQMKPEASNPKPATEEKEQATESAPEANPRTSVLEDARKFLEEDEVKDASTDKKVAFLEGKGLTSEEIHQLLGITRNLEASNPESQVRLHSPSSSRKSQLTQYRPPPNRKHHPPNPSQPPHHPLHNHKHPNPKSPLNLTATPRP